MDAGHKSKRLFPAMTIAEIKMSLSGRTNPLSEVEAALVVRLELALRQRDPTSPDFVPAFKVPQVAPFKFGKPTK